MKVNKKWARALLRQRVFILFILIMQIAFLIFLSAGTSIYFKYVNWAIRFLSIGVCVHLLQKHDKATYKFIWLLLIVLFPFFGGVVYIISYTQSNYRKLKKTMNEISHNTKDLFFLSGDSYPNLVQACPEFKNQAYYLQHYSGYPVYANTAQEYFPSGETFFSRLLEELEKAERYIFFEFFIIREGVMLDPVISILERKAQEGLDVRFMYDDMGCFMSLPADFRQQLEQKGIKCHVFNPFKPILSSIQNNRDHRKIISIDGKVAFTGGINLADEYINAIDRFGHWKDSAIMLCGEGAWSLTLIYLRLWNLFQNSNDDYESFYPWKNSPCTVKTDGYVQPYADSPIDNENISESVYIQIINRAKKYVYINTPYLVVDDNLLSALTLAAKGGVDVRIITPHRWDKLVMAIASRSYYRQLIKAGVKVYEYTAGFNHGKTFVSDDKVATVGTTNLDFRSLYLHFECGVLIYRGSAIKAIKKDFLATVPISHQISLKECARNVLQRIVPDLLRIFAPLM